MEGADIVDDFRYALATRRRHIEELRELAENHDRLSRAYNEKLKAPLGTKVVGGVVLAAGGCVAVASSFMTGGLAAPLWASCLVAGGTGCGVGGGVWGLSLDLEMKKKEKLLQDRIIELFREDEEVQRRAKRAIENLQLLDFDDTARLMTQLKGVLNLYIGLNTAFGSTVAVSMMVPLALTPIPLFVGKIASISSVLGPIVTKATEEIGKMIGKEMADEVAAEVVKDMKPGMTKWFVKHHAKVAAKAAGDKATKELAGNAAQEVAEVR